MKERKRDAARIKLLTGIAIPLFIVVITSITVGVSFAWFSQSSDITVETLNLTTRPVFTLTFTETTGSADNKYFGETAFGTDGHLVTPDWAAGNPPNGLGLTPESGEYDRYILDEPYMRKTAIKLDTEEKRISMNILFDYVRITITDNEVVKELALFDVSKGNLSDISYAFTWLLTKNDGTYYTPYGKMDSSAKFPWTTLPEKQGVTEFTATAADTYEFWIIFAPERLYWSQYCSEAWTKKLGDIYTAEEIEKIVDRANGYGNQPFYSSPIFTGAEFTMSATIAVTDVDWGGEGA